MSEQSDTIIGNINLTSGKIIAVEATETGTLLNVNLKDNTQSFSLTELISFATDGLLALLIPTHLDVLANPFTLEELELKLSPDNSEGSNMSFTFGLDKDKTWGFTDKLTLGNIKLRIEKIYFPPSDHGNTNLVFYRAGLHGEVTIGEVFEIWILFTGLDSLIADIIPKEGNILPGIDAIAGLIGGNSLKQQIKTDLETIRLDSLAITKVEISFALAQTSLLYISVYSEIIIAGLKFEMYLQPPLGASSGWKFAGNLNRETPLKVGELVGELVSYFSIGDGSVPEVVADLEIIALEIGFDTGSKNFAFHMKLSLPIESKQLPLNLTLELTKDQGGSGYTKSFTGTLSLEFDPDQSPLVFEIDLQDSSTASSIVGSVDAFGLTLSINDLVQSVITDDEVLAFIPDIEVDLNSLLFVYRKSKGGTPADNQMLFGINLDTSIGFSNLPLAGKAIPADASIAVNGVQLLMASNDITLAEVNEVNGLLPQQIEPLPTPSTGGASAGATDTSVALKKGFNVAAKIDFGSSQPTLSLPANESNTAQPAPGNGTSTPPADPAKWIKIQKSFGPVTIEQVGLEISKTTDDPPESLVKILLSAGLKVGPLAFILDGLWLGTPISNLDPQQFSIDQLKLGLRGLGLDYASGPIELSGMLLRAPDDPDDDIKYEFSGEITLQAEVLSLSALGSYAKMEDGAVSLFVYVAINYPLGGPSFFFVTGLAAGFGYNRRLQTPPINQLRAFPLIGEVIGEPPRGAADVSGDGDPPSTGELLRAKMESLNRYIFPQEGQYFLAAGLRFSSFQLLDCFALLTVNFGQHFDIGVMGFARLAVPTEAPEPVAEVEMLYSVRFDPEEGFLGVNAYLTPSSYVLSGLCKLSGGFAFYSWFSGLHSGDFVVTLGGYNSKFHIPSHYPQPAEVPRLTLSWKVSDELSIKGQLYFALTPKAMMVGGNLDATFKLGEDGDFLVVDAGFHANADFLIYWKPFHYEADASIEVHADITLNFALFSVSGGISAGADLTLWGPSFAGTADVHAKVLGYKAHFTVDFGEDRQVPPPLDWDKFSSSFLPDAPVPVINASKGLIKSVSEQWVINPKTLQLALSLIVPTTQPIEKYTREDGSDLTSITGASDDSSRLGIDPMRLPSFNSRIGIRLMYKKPGTKVWKPLTDSFRIVSVRKKFPKALWTTRISQGVTPNINDQQMIEATGGYLITPLKAPKAADSHDFEVSVLDFEMVPVNSIAPSHSTLTIEVKNDMDFKSGDINNTTSPRQTLLADLGLDSATEVEFQPEFNESFTLSPQTTQITLSHE